MPIPERIRLALAGFSARHGVLTSHLEVTRLSLQIAGLSEHLEGFSIAHVSDFHIGHGAWQPVHAEEAAGIIQEERPDMVVNTGDYLQEAPPLEKVGATASGFVVPPPSGSHGSVNLAVLGNHDYFAGDVRVAGLKSVLEALSVRPLINAGTCLRVRGAGVSFFGLTTEEPGFDEAVHLLFAADRPRIVLVHEPEIAELLPPGSADLILAGHTHGGQMTLPGLTPFIVRRFAETRYGSGLYHVNDVPVYINRGLGNTGLPFRFRATPEVTFIRLVR